MEISFADFIKVEMRIGTILAIEPVEGADRLLKLSVDLGEDSPRQVVSGIREFISNPEEVIGRQCPFVVNLPTRTIRGLESQAMIVAGGEGEDFTLLHPEKKVSAGMLLQ